MRLSYTYVNEPQPILGISDRASQTQTPDGFARDLLNVDIVESDIQKRKGYEIAGGGIPVRVDRLDYKASDTSICFTLPDAVDLSRVPNSPIIVRGRSSLSSGGPFTNASIVTKYYSAATVPTRKTLLATASAPAFETLSVPAAEHNLGVAPIFVGLGAALSTSGSSYEYVVPEEVSVDTGSTDITYSYQNSTGSDIQAFTYYAARPVTAGTTHLTNYTKSGSSPVSIPVATHNLSSTRIIARVWEDTGSDLISVTPDAVNIAGNGDVSIVLEALSGTDFLIYLTVADGVSASAVSVPAQSSGTLTIPNVMGPWVFPTIYAIDGVNGELTEVLPDSWQYDQATDSVQVSFQNSSPDAVSFVSYYVRGVSSTNQICVTDAAVVGTATDLAPELFIYGLRHDEIYGVTSGSRPGWVNHIDTYRSSGENQLIAGLGGDLFRLSNTSSLLPPTLLSNLRARLNSDQTVGPVFIETIPGPGIPRRSRGYILGSNSGTNLVQVTQVQYHAGSGETRYTLSIPGLDARTSSDTATTASSVISAGGSLPDSITFSDMHLAPFSGTFPIASLSQPSATTLVVGVVIPGVNSSDDDDLHSQGLAGIFSDRLVHTATVPFVAGDTLLSPGLDTEDLGQISAVNGSSIVVLGLTEPQSFQSGSLVVARRNSAVVPLRTASGTASVGQLVRGDMVLRATSQSGWDSRLMQVLSVNTSGDVTVSSLTQVSGSTYSASISGSTLQFFPGCGLFLTGIGDIVVDEVTGPTTFTFTAPSGVTVPSSSVIRGNTVFFDEVVAWQDQFAETETWAVAQRWDAINGPEQAGTDVSETQPSPFLSLNYDEQTFVRSTMTADSLYLTNTEDQVIKYDGSRISRAGLIPWQAGALLTVEEDSGAIVVDSPSVTPSDFTDGVFTVPLGRQTTFKIGGVLRHSFTGGSTDYEVVDIGATATDGLVRVRNGGSSVLGTSPVLTKFTVIRYAFRLNLVDANGSVVASATTGYQDHVVVLDRGSRVNLKLLRPVILPLQDNQRLELVILRTKGDTVAPFYKVTTIALASSANNMFNAASGYITYVDSFPDASLIELDEVTSALKGTELGINWTPPPEAKYLTSAGNSLVAANFRSSPELDIQIVAPASVLNASYAGTTWSFRKLGVSGSSTTNMLDTVKYSLVGATSGTTSSFSYSVGNNFTFTTSGWASPQPGDWVYLTYSSVALANRDLSLCGWWQVKLRPAPNQVTIDFPGVTVPASTPDVYVIAPSPVDVPVLLGVDGSLGMVNGDSFDLFDVGRRLSMAINASMVKVNTAITSMADFKPWLMARGGNDVGKAGRVLVTGLETSPTVTLPSFTAYEVFVNGVRAASASTRSSRILSFPSRVLVSYENYPEIFDAPFTTSDIQSDSAIDINPSDGQEITGIIPFFGTSAFGAAAQSAFLLVFKTNSIYLVDLEEKRKGQPAVQRVETEGIGCTMPYSIASTKNGIMFANEAGIYRIGRNQAIQYIGRRIENLWRKVDTSTTGLDSVHGHHFNFGRQYKISYPRKNQGGAIDDVLVYDHTNEAEGGPAGAWTRYDSHSATGWCNLGERAFFGATSGQVMSIRQRGTVSDYRDNADAIDATVKTRRSDFGSPAIRKVVNQIMVAYPRTSNQDSFVQDVINSDVAFSVDSSTAYEDSTSVVNAGALPSSIDNMGDENDRDLIHMYHSPVTRRGTYFSVQLRNAIKDSFWRVASIVYQVAGLSNAGQLEAGQATDEDTGSN